MSLTPKLLSFAVMLALGGTAAAANTNSPAVGRALGLIQTHASAVRASASDQFIARDVIRDANGTEHVRFDRTYGGLPVIGGDVVVHSRNGQLVSTSLTQHGPLTLGTRPVLGSADAIVAAGGKFGSRFTGTPGAELVVYARGNTPVLAYRVHMGNDNSDMTYIVSARDGKVLDSWSNRETAGAAGTGKTLYSGNITVNTNSITGGFEMRDTTRGNSTTINAHTGKTSGLVFTDADNTWGNNANSDPASGAADANFGGGKTWDYYKNVHGRNGIANNGVGAQSRVHFGVKYFNAFWSDNCFCMTYGDGDGVVAGPLVALDVAGHEMSHGVTSRTANLTYSGESGGLNEATSDIFGTMVEFYANNAFDTPDYLIGEEIYLANIPGDPNQQALRYMFNPFKDTRSPNCYVGTLGDLDVHYSSGVANHFFYLLAEGSGAKAFSGVDHTSPVCSGGALAGIGRAHAEKIWYRALTVYMTSGTNYHGARVATLAAATDLYGGASAEYNAVAATWSAVSVN